MTESQRLALIEMHKRMEKAYRKFGQIEKAEQARKQMEKLESK